MTPIPHSTNSLYALWIEFEVLGSVDNVALRNRSILPPSTERGEGSAEHLTASSFGAPRRLLRLAGFLFPKTKDSIHLRAPMMVDCCRLSWLSVLDPATALRFEVENLEVRAR